MVDNLYKIVWDSEDDGLLYGVSIVDKPANKYQALQLSEQEEIQLQVEDKEKKQLAGVVLIPNQVINRKNKNLGEYKIVFEENTIEKLAHNIFIGDYHKNSWYNHDREKQVQGSTIVESWIISDETKDKALSLGFKDLPKGTWMIVMQLSDKAWDEYIKTGKAKGFSVDSIMSLKKVNFENNNDNKINLKMENYLKKIVNLLEKDKEKEEVKMITIEREEGNLEVPSLEEGQMVTMDGQPFEGSFEYEGNMYSTDKEGMINSISPVEEEMSTEDMVKGLEELFAENVELKESVGKMFKKEDKEIVNMSLELAEKDEDTKKVFEKLFLEEIKALEAKVESKDQEIVKLQEKLDETPSKGKLKANVDLNDDKPLTGLEKIRTIINK